MQLIDFHVHVFPDALAERAVSSLGKTVGLKPLTDGTLKDTCIKMKEWNVDSFVTLNIAVKPNQQTNVNNFAKEVQESKSVPTAYSFGSVHPLAEDCIAEMERVRNLSLKGIKLHAPYQGLDIDDEKYYPIFDYASETGLPVLIHSGYDPYDKNHIYASPSAIARISRDFPKMTFIAAHLGGLCCFEEVSEYIVGKNIYFDTAFIANTISKEMAKKIIEKHGCDKVLFGSDCPWTSSEQTFEFIDSLGLSSSNLDLIFHKNAQSLLGIN